MNKNLVYACVLNEKLQTSDVNDVAFNRTKDTFQLYFLGYGLLSLVKLDQRRWMIAVPLRFRSIYLSNLCTKVYKGETHSHRLHEKSNAK